MCFLSLVIASILVRVFFYILSKGGKPIRYEQIPANEADNELNRLAFRVQREAQARQTQLQEIRTGTRGK